VIVSEPEIGDNEHMARILPIADEQALLDRYVRAELTAINERSGSIGEDVLALRAAVIDYAERWDLRFDPEPFAPYSYLDEE